MPMEFVQFAYGHIVYEVLDEFLWIEITSAVKHHRAVRQSRIVADTTARYSPLHAGHFLGRKDLRRKQLSKTLKTIERSGWS